MNRKYQWLEDFLLILLKEEIIESTELQLMHSYPMLEIPAPHWGIVLRIAASRNYRFVSLWAAEITKKFQLHAVIEYLGEHFFLQSIINISDPRIASVTPYYPAANRLERHTHDMFGIFFINHPDQRRWTRHCAWQENQFPLRKDFPAYSSQNTTTPPDNDYPFIKAHGSGIYEIPVGPVHAGIIEPGHFRFQAAGEDIIKLEEHLGYTHKGIEKIAEGRDIPGLIKLAARVSGDSTVAHAWAACMAAENAYYIGVPIRAIFLRAIMAERERIANHLGDFAAICNDVGFSFAYYQFMRLKELWLRLNNQAFGNRLMMDCLLFTGVKNDLNDSNKNAMLKQLSSFNKELTELYSMIEENSSLHDRLKSTGKLTPEKAAKLNVLGYVGHASGIRFDLRHDAPYSPYQQITVKVPVYNFGDVLARIRVRAQEILASLEILTSLLTELPDGPISLASSALSCASEGVGLVEGFRGEIITYVKFDKSGLVERFFPRDPSWFSWPALEELIDGNIVPDFPVCNKSINGSYSGVDL